MYAGSGRASIPPERLLRASLIQTLYTIRSERQLVQHIEYNLLYRWFVGLDMDDPVWDHSSFTQNRDRLLNEAVGRAFFGKVLGLAEWQGLVSSEHFTVDGTLIEAWASMKSFKAKDGSGKPPEDVRQVQMHFFTQTAFAKSISSFSATTDHSKESPNPFLTRHHAQIKTEFFNGIDITQTFHPPRVVLLSSCSY